MNIFDYKKYSFQVKYPVSALSSFAACLLYARQPLILTENEDIANRC